MFELKGTDEAKLARHQAALKPVKTTMMKRSNEGDLKWVICNYPTDSLAEAQKMTLSDYTDFIADACFLTTDNPTAKWQQLSDNQERYVEVLIVPVKFTIRRNMLISHFQQLIEFG